jgi:hypothetical protein
MFYDVHLLGPADWDDPQGALARAAARALHIRQAGSDTSAPSVEPPSADAPVVGQDVLTRVRATWLRPGEGLRVDAQGGTLLVRLPYWYVGRQARTQAKVLHAVVSDLEKASGRRGYDPQLQDWFTGRAAADTAAVLDAVAEFQSREHVDSPAVDARRAERAASGRRPRLGRAPRRS